ncbi:alpha/beta fold hydrolase [Nitriliruptor alkaliphilus]|uniref:alpha/beta fold hydrolase n=1 Tax=Nitriliruptor alkaliphilus TaxID=427918 RepID=UPI000697E143|nr:alpha/beta hydrolase [Nitriliruptor alkaliphilus]
MGSGTVRANGIEWALTSAGPPDAPLALCLHGFPDTSATWRHLLPQLAAAGFHAVAPAMRGYAPTEVPPDRRTDPDTLTADVNALHRALGGRRDAVLIGHDWGAIAGARAAAAAPDRWRRLVTLAVPPESVVAQARLDVPQARRSWYVVAAQLPGSEALFTARDLALIRRLWHTWSPGYQLQPADLDPLRATFAVPGVARAVLSYFRGFATAAAENRAASRRVTLPPQPHLHLHGRDDGCIGAAIAERAVGVLPHPASRVEVLDGLGHFLHLEDPVTIGARIVEFVTTGRPAVAPR